MDVGIGPSVGEIRLERVKDHQPSRIIHHAETTGRLIIMFVNLREPVRESEMYTVNTVGEWKFDQGSLGEDTF